MRKNKRVLIGILCTIFCISFIFSACDTINRSTQVMAEQSDMSLPEESDLEASTGGSSEEPSEESSEEPREEIETDAFVGSDVSHLVTMGTPTIYRLDGDGNKIDIVNGDEVTAGQYVGLTIPWSIASTAGITTEDYFLFSISSNTKFAVPNLNGEIRSSVDDKVLGHYTIDGNYENGVYDENKTPTIKVSLTQDAIEAVSLQGYVSFGGHFIVVVSGGNLTVHFNGTAEGTPNVEVLPTPIYPLDPVPVQKYGYYNGGKLRWDILINRDTVITSYNAIYQGAPLPASAQNKMFLSDELEPGQYISSSDIEILCPVNVSSSLGKVYDYSTTRFFIATVTSSPDDLFDKVDKSSSEISKSDFENEIRNAAKPTIGVYNHSVLFINFGDVSRPDGSSALNLKNIPDGENTLELSLNNAQNDLLGEGPGGLLSESQKDIIREHWSVNGINKGNFTTFCVSINVAFSEAGTYENDADVDYENGETLTGSGATVISDVQAGITPSFGTAKLIKIDSDDNSIKLAGAIFKLQKESTSGTFIDVAGKTNLTTDANGEVNVNGLSVGRYRFFETTPPDGYTPANPFEFAVLSGEVGAVQVMVTAPNVKKQTVGAIELIKKDGEGKPLAGAIFILTRENGGRTEYYTKTTGNDNEKWSTDRNAAMKLVSSGAGKIHVDNLSEGSYQMIETLAPQGFKLDATPVIFVLSANDILEGKTISKAMTNTDEEVISSSPESESTSSDISSNISSAAPSGTPETSSAIGILSTDKNGPTTGDRNSIASIFVALGIVALSITAIIFILRKKFNLGRP